MNLNRLLLWVAPPGAAAAAGIWHARQSLHPKDNPAQSAKWNLGIGLGLFAASELGYISSAPMRRVALMLSGAFISRATYNLEFRGQANRLATDKPDPETGLLPFATGTWRQLQADWGIGSDAEATPSV